MLVANTALLDILVDNSVIIPSFQNRTILAELRARTSISCRFCCFFSSYIAGILNSQAAGGFLWKFSVPKMHSDKRITKMVCFNTAMGFHCRYKQKLYDFVKTQGYIFFLRGCVYETFWGRKTFTGRPQPKD